MSNCIFRPLGTGPGDLNDSDDACLAVGIGGFIVPESVDIVRVCQDPDNVNIIFMDVNTVGVFDYTPELKIEYIDRNGSPQQVDVSNRFVFNYDNESQAPDSFPILTNCTSATSILAWDVGTQIPDFGSLHQLTMRLKMYGEFSAASFDSEILGEIANVFQSVNPTAEYVFTKGLSPRPHALFFDEDTGELKLQYSNMGGLPCFCDIACADIAEENQELNVCDDEIQEISVTTSSIVGDPTSISLVFRDVIGNSTDLSTQLMYNVIPKAPDAFRITDDNPHIKVNPFFLSENEVRIDHENVDYQIWRYEGKESNAKLIQDWTSKKWTTFIDYEINSDRKYGYSIRFRGPFGEVSGFSPWRVIAGLMLAIGFACAMDFGTFDAPFEEQELGTFAAALLDCDLGTF